MPQKLPKIWDMAKTRISVYTLDLYIIYMSKICSYFKDTQLIQFVNQHKVVKKLVTVENNFSI